MKRLMTITLLVICFTICEAQVIENPVFDSTNQPTFHINKVEITSDTTFVYCSYSAVANGWANISSNTYLLCYPSKNKHKIFSCSGLPYAPEKRYFSYDGICEIVFRFPSIKGASHFDFIENKDDNAFNIYGVSLYQQFERTYKESEINRFSNRSSFYDLVGDTAKALHFKRNEVESVKYIFGEKSTTYITTVINLCDLYSKYGYNIEAIKHITFLSKKISELKGDESMDLAIIKSIAAEYYSREKDYEHSIKNCKDAIEIFESLDSINERYASTLSLLSDEFSAYGLENESIKYRQKNLDVRKKLKDSDKYLEDLGALIMGLGDYDNHYERLEIAKKELENLPVFVDTTTISYISVLRSMVQSHIAIDDYKSALSYCDRSLAIFGNDNDHIIRISELLGYKSICHYWLKNIEESISLGEKAINTFDSLHVQPSIYMNILTYLVLSYMDKYDYENAILISKRVSVINEEKHDWLSLAESLEKIGSCYYKLEDLENAYYYFNKSWNIINNHDKAEDYLEQTIAGTEITHKYILDSIKKNINEDIISTKASCLTSLARVLWKKGDSEEAINHLLKSGDFYKKLQNNFSYAGHLMTLSGYYYENHQLNEAITCAEESIELFKKYGKFNYSPSILNLAMIYNEKGDIQRAISYANEAVTVSERFGDYYAMTNGLYYLFYFYYYINEYYKAEEALSKELDFLQNNIAHNIVQMSKEQKQRLWHDAEYSFLAYRELLEKIKWDGVFVARLYDYTLFFKSILLDSENSDITNYQIRTKTKWRDIQDKLTDQDISIEFISTMEGLDNKRYYALVIDKFCKYPYMITLFDEQDFESQKQAGKRSILQILGDLIWGALLNQYKHVKNIYFSPDGIIHLVPIEHCQVDGIGDIMEHYNLYRLTSTKEIIFKDKRIPKKNAVLYGGLDYDMLSKEANNLDKNEYSLLRNINARGGFDPLLSTLEEVKEINNLLKTEKVQTRLYTGGDGTEDSFKDLSGKDINMLHLSTHGMYVGPSTVEQRKKENNFNFLELITNDKDPVKEDIVLTHSFLVMSGGNKLSHRETIGNGLSDGILTAFEISQVDLSKLDIVVLSACETGLGDIENSGIYGLQRGFKKAGVNTILMSLDKVDDEATKILMVEFYKNLMEGKSKHESLKDAQMYLRQVENGKYDKPDYWASFILLDGLN